MGEWQGRILISQGPRITVGSTVSRGGCPHSDLCQRHVSEEHHEKAVQISRGADPVAIASGTALLALDPARARLPGTTSFLYGDEPGRQRVHLRITLQPHRHTSDSASGTLCLGVVTANWRRSGVSGQNQSACCNCMVSFGAVAGWSRSTLARCSYE